VFVEASQMADIEQQMMKMLCFDIMSIIKSSIKRMNII
jgi:hypothetical protein